MGKTKTERKFALIQSFEKIVIKAIQCNGELDKLPSNDRDLRKVSGFLGVNTVQASLFVSVFILNFKERSVDISDIAGYLESSNMKIVRFIPDLDVLEKKKLIKRKKIVGHIAVYEAAGVSEYQYSIPRNVLDAILETRKELLIKNRQHNTLSLLEEVGNMIEARDDNELTFSELCGETSNLIEENAGLDFIKRLTRLGIIIDDLLILFYVGREMANGNDGTDLARTCEKIFEDVNVRFMKRRDMLKGRSRLMKEDLLKLRDGFMRSDREILLTDKALETIFGEDKDVFIRAEGISTDMMECTNIKLKELFYNKHEEEQLNFLEKLLSQENYLRMSKSLEEKNMPKGVNILFHGEPGTGKTASVYEIARRTGRHLFVVDISDTKSMWFGESEKKIKRLFEKYKHVIKNEKMTPIMIFNECDAVLSTRKQVGNSPVDQTENAIQNIILQEMENMEGIMIATTNLTRNLDPAFERRFLFKIAFKKPDQNTRKLIWQSKLSFLNEGDSLKLARDFDFSGGLIENIARKVNMQETLTGEAPGLEKIRTFCREEKYTGEGSGRGRMGF